MSFLRESSFVLYRNLLIDANIGTISEVEFNFETIWKMIQRFKEIEPFDIDELAFLHTHAKEIGTNCSFKDIICMKGLNIAFGSPVPFYIGVYDTDLKKWSFEGYKLLYKEGNDVLIHFSKPLALTEDLENTLTIFSFSSV